MFSTLPESPQAANSWSWEDFHVYYQDLLARTLDENNLESWLSDWSSLQRIIDERYVRLIVATTRDTTDQEAEKSFYHFLDTIQPASRAADQQLREKLLDSGLSPENFDVPLRNMRADAALFRKENLKLLAEEEKLVGEVDKIIGAQTVVWEGQEKTVAQMNTVYQNFDRSVRERAWHLATERQLADRQKFNNVWISMLKLRLQIAHNTGYQNYRDYCWQKMKRFSYTPEDCLQFHQAIEEVAVPAAQRIYEKRKRRLGIDKLRPWDLYVDPYDRPALRPFQETATLIHKTGVIFKQVDPALGAYFQTMRDEDLLDLDNRKGKAPGGFCVSYEVSKRPFILMNSIGVHEDVQTLLHEGGHAFHVFESAHLPYFEQKLVPMEFAEVASMAMELLAAPYLTEDQGGFYSPSQAARARIENLEGGILFWPYMAVVDAFQHWVYEHPEAALEPENCEETWAALYERFMPGIELDGLEAYLQTGWQRKLHIFQVPFYYIEYGLAQLGAVQVWSNALEDQAGAVKAYRKALAMGGTVDLTALFATAGAKFAFDSSTLTKAIGLMEKIIQEMENVAAANESGDI